MKILAVVAALAALSVPALGQGTFDPRDATSPDGTAAGPAPTAQPASTTLDSSAQADETVQPQRLTIPDGRHGTLDINVHSICGETAVFAARRTPGQRGRSSRARLVYEGAAINRRQLLAILRGQGYNDKAIRALERSVRDLGSEVGGLRYDLAHNVVRKDDPTWQDVQNNWTTVRQQADSAVQKTDPAWSSIHGAVKKVVENQAVLNNRMDTAHRRISDVQMAMRVVPGRFWVALTILLAGFGAAGYLHATTPLGHPQAPRRDLLVSIAVGVALAALFYFLA